MSALIVSAEMIFFAVLLEPKSLAKTYLCEASFHYHMLMKPACSDFTQPKALADRATIDPS